MASKPSSMTERAEQLARSGEFEFVYQIERRLKAEGYPAVETSFEKTPQLQKTLREIMKARLTAKLAPKG